jgi:hypothetical protein
MQDVFVGLGVAGLVGDVPAEGLEKGIDELEPYLGFVVGRIAVGLDVLVEPLYQILDLTQGFIHRA